MTLTPPPKDPSLASWGTCTYVHAPICIHTKKHMQAHTHTCRSRHTHICTHTHTHKRFIRKRNKGRGGERGIRNLQEAKRTSSGSFEISTRAGHVHSSDLTRRQQRFICKVTELEMCHYVCVALTA